MFAGEMSEAECDKILDELETKVGSQYQKLTDDLREYIQLRAQLNECVKKFAAKYN